MLLPRATSSVLTFRPACSNSHLKHLHLSNLRLGFNIAAAPVALHRAHAWRTQNCKPCAQANSKDCGYCVAHTATLALNKTAEEPWAKPGRASHKWPTLAARNCRAHSTIRATFCSISSVSLLSKTCMPILFSSSPSGYHVWQNEDIHINEEVLQLSQIQRTHTRRTACSRIMNLHIRNAATVD
jgi:hypothetical protein